MILEIHLNDLVGKPKHYSVLGSHPFLNIDDLTDLSAVACWNRLLGGVLGEQLILLLHWSNHWLLAISFKVAFKVLKKSNLLVYLLWVITQFMCLNDLLFICDPSFKVIKPFPSRLKDDLGGVVEKDSSRSIGQKVPKPIFLTVVNPFLDPDLRTLSGQVLLLERSDRLRDHR